MAEQLLTIKEVAQRLRVGKSFVYQALVTGRLKHYVLGAGSGGKRVSEGQPAEYLRSVEKGGLAEVPAAPAVAPKRLKNLSLG